MRHSSLCIASRSQAGRQSNQGLGPSKGKKFFYPAQTPNSPWRPPNLLYNQYRHIFPCGKAADAWSWPICPLLPRLRMHGDKPPLPDSTFTVWCVTQEQWHFLYCAEELSWYGHTKTKRKRSCLLLSERRGDAWLSCNLVYLMDLTVSRFRNEKWWVP